MRANPILNFYALVWKDDTALYFPDGQSRALSCQHTNEGTYGVNIRGEAFPVQTSTNNPLTPSPPDTSTFDVQTGFVQSGNVYGTSNPFYTGSPDYKLCVKIKDMNTLVTSYVDATSYAANISTCNVTLTT